MATVRDRILDYLKRHPEGVDDDDLALALGLKQRQHANSVCRQLAAEGLVVRRTVDGKLHNFLATSARTSPPAASPRPAPAPVQPPAATLEPPPQSAGDQPWFWEGNVQEAVVAYLRNKGYRIVRSADTATRETGKDIEAQGSDGRLWVTVKGFPAGTPRTQPSTQAGHWFKQALFDIVAWRQENPRAGLVLALPDYPRYRGLAQIVKWLQSAAPFEYYWVQEDGTIEVG